MSFLFAQDGPKLPGRSPLNQMEKRVSSIPVLLGPAGMDNVRSRPIVIDSSETDMAADSAISNSAFCTCILRQSLESGITTAISIPPYHAIVSESPVINPELTFESLFFPFFDRSLS